MGIPINTAVQGYFLLRHDLADDTVVHYRVVFNAFMEFIEAGTEMESITSTDIRAFLGHARKERNLSDRSVADYWVPLSSLWTWAEVELDVPHIIRGKVKRPSYPAPVIKDISMDEIKHMIAASEYSNEWDSRSGTRTRSKRPDALRDKAIILTLLDTGLRASELCQAAVGDYDAEQGQIFVRKGKYRKQRYVHLGKRARTVIWKYWATREDLGPKDPLFSTKTGRFLDRNNLRHTLQRIAERAGVRGLTLHRFRHTFAINFLRNGGNVFALQRMLGHEDLDTVRVYLSIVEADLVSAQKVASPVDNWRL